MSSTISATAQPIVTDPATSWSFASNGGGGVRRGVAPGVGRGAGCGVGCGVGCGLGDSLTRPGYEVASATNRGTLRAVARA